MRINLIIWLLFCSSFGFSQGLHVEIPMEYANDEEARYLAKDSSGFLRIATDRGIYSHYGTSTDFLPIKSIPTVLLNTDWLGTIDGRLYKLSQENKPPVRIADSTAISCLLEYEDKIFIGTEGEGLFVFEPQTDSVIAVELSDPFVYDLATWNNRIFVATDRGVEVYQPDEDKLLKKLNSGITTQLCVWEDALVASAYGEELMVYQPDGSSESIPISGGIRKVDSEGDQLFILNENGVYEKLPGRPPTLLYASEGIIDLAYLEERGLALLDRDGKLTFVDLRFSVFHETDGTTITALARNDSTLFIAAGGSVKSKRIDKSSKERTFTFPGTPAIVNMVATNEKLFAGSFDQGLFTIDLASGGLKNFNLRNGLLDNSVLGMAELNDSLWFSTLSGLTYLAPDGSIEYIEDINSTYIYDLFAADGILWIGTDGNGLLKKQGSQIVSTSEELSQSTVYKICQDGAGNLRCITKEQGIYELTSQGFSRMHQDDDYDGYTAFGCGPANTTLLIDDGKLVLIKSGQTAIYDEQSGFGRLTDAFLNTFTRPTNEEVYFASGTNIYRYRPESQLPSIQVNLVEATSDFEPIGFDHPEIAHDANNLIFQLAAPWYRNPEDIEFRYRLKGLEEFRLTKNPDLIYPHLPYSEYVLEAQAGHKGIFHGSPEQLIAFKVNRPFYLNPWFILIAVLLFALIVYFIVKIRVANINRLRLAEKRLVESELAVLRTQVNPHFLFNSFNTLMTIIEPESKAGAEYLEKLSDFYRRILEENKSQVITIEEELKILEEYIFLQKKRFGEAFEVDIRLSEGTKSGFIPALTFQLLAENALKHNLATRSNPLKILIVEEGDWLNISNPIRQKRKEAEGTGMGLENISSRYETLFKKRIEIINDGKTFSVKLPKIKSEYARTDS